MNRSNSAGSLSGVGPVSNQQQHVGNSSNSNNIVNGNANANGMSSEDGYATLGRGNNGDSNSADHQNAITSASAALALEDLHELLEEPVEEELEMVSAEKGVLFFYNPTKHGRETVWELSVRYLHVIYLHIICSM